MSLETLTERLRQAAAENPPLGYKVKFDLGEAGIILWDGTVTPAVIGNEEGAADTTLRLSEAAAEDLVAGTLDPTMAYMTGKLKVEGSMGVALKLANLLGD
jgi:putative sterol carrier protein